MDFSTVYSILLLVLGMLLIAATVWTILLGNIRGAKAESDDPPGSTVIKIFGFEISTGSLRHVALFIGVVLVLAAGFFHQDSEARGRPTQDFRVALEEFASSRREARLALEAPENLQGTSRLKRFKDFLAGLGIQVDADAPDKIIVTVSGRLELHVDGRKRTESPEAALGPDPVVEPESIVPPSRIKILVGERGKPEVMADREFQAELRTEIHRSLSILERGYNTSDLELLKGIFEYDLNPRILVGKVERNDVLRWEHVEYELLSTPDYLGRLEGMISRGKGFEVRIRPVEIYRESSQRYWVLAHQEWSSFDGGRPRDSASYTDDGFLILTLQSDEGGRYVPKVYFRIWINNYRYTRREGGREIPRKELVLSDFDRVYGKVTGIRKAITEEIRADIASLLDGPRRGMGDFPKVVTESRRP